MNRFQDNAIKCAMALFVAAAMSACSSSEDVPDDPNVNPTYDGNSVKTQFAINVSKAGKSTRMSADETQAGESNPYLGMTNVRLFTFTGTPAAASTVGSYIELATPSSVGGTQSSHIYKNVDIPVGTKHFLFYSTREGMGGADHAGKFGTGSIKSKLFETGSSFSALNDADFKFSGEKVLTDADNAQILSVRSAFETYLNGIDEALTTTIDGLTSGSQVKTQLTSFQNSFRGKWSQSQKQRAGSADAILRQVQSLYTNVNGIVGLTDKTTINNAILKDVKDNADNTLFTVEQSSGTLRYSDATAADYKTFPTAQNLPEGTQVLSYTVGGEGFKYVTANPVIGGANNISTENIIYPLPIVYFDNTPARATDSDISSWATTAGNWNLDAQWTGWGEEVLETTQSIALKNNINYGVAVLKTTVKCNGTTLEDNKKAYYAEEDNQTITIPADGYPITGILIGGQPQSVGWEMVDATEEERSFVVYDRETNSAKASNSGSDAIYTLVFDNWNSNNQESVNVAIELQNESDAFYGQDGIVEKGQKFYLIGKLDPNGATNSGTFAWPTYSDAYGSATAGQLPKSYQGCYPVKSGSNRVFIQDYTTTANFTIRNLKNAYVTIPDLRATKLQIGISVDLQWEAGLTFDVDL